MQPLVTWRPKPSAIRTMPITSRKVDASMITVGLSWTKGVSAKIETVGYGA